MPLEIRELVIKATINDASAPNLSGTSISMTISAADTELLMREIQDRVINALTDKSEKEQTGFLPASFDIPPVRRR